MKVAEIKLALREARENLRSICNFLRVSRDDGMGLDAPDSKEIRHLAHQVEGYASEVWSLGLDLQEKETREGDRLADDNEASKEALIEE